MKKDKLLNIAFLSTCPPRECGLATFTQDLIDAIDATGVVATNLIAVNNAKHRDYSDKVIYEINQNSQKDYIELAQILNHSNIDLLVIEHEYGIYGGDHGDYILDLLNNIEIPVITTLHTILREPNEKQKLIIKTLGEKSAKIVTMAKNTSIMLLSASIGIKAKTQKICVKLIKETGACYDGINENGLNLNQGSENIVSYGMAVMNVFKIKVRTGI